MDAARRALRQSNGFDRRAAGRQQGIGAVALFGLAAAGIAQQSAALARIILADCRRARASAAAVGRNVDRAEQDAEQQGQGGNRPLAPHHWRIFMHAIVPRRRMPASTKLGSAPPGCNGSARTHASFR
jgi:hypothetical protein